MILLFKLIGCLREIGFYEVIQSVICSGFEDTINWLIKKNLVSSKGTNIVSTIGIGFGKVVVVS